VYSKISNAISSFVVILKESNYFNCTPFFLHQWAIYIKIVFPLIYPRLSTFRCCFYQFPADLSIFSKHLQQDFIAGISTVDTYFKNYKITQKKLKENEGIDE
jgi:hypothetical protein